MAVFTHMDSMRHILGANAADGIRADQGEDWLILAALCGVSDNPDPIECFFLAWHRFNEGTGTEQQYDGAVDDLRLYVAKHPELAPQAPS